MSTTVITQLPLFTDLVYRYGTPIEGQQKQFTFRWNERARQWHMDIRNEDQTVVVLAVPLVAEYPMLADHPMGSFGLSGYFVLLPNIVGTPPSITGDSSVVPESFNLAYVYIQD